MCGTKNFLLKEIYATYAKLISKATKAEWSNVLSHLTSAHIFALEHNINTSDVDWSSFVKSTRLKTFGVYNGQTLREGWVESNVHSFHMPYMNQGTGGKTNEDTSTTGTK